MQQLTVKDGTALIFSGGGARGAFEYGVWKALRELDAVNQIKGIAGTSIGALNTLFYIQKDFYKAGDMWRSLNMADAIRINRSFLSLLWTILKAFPIGLHNLSDLFKIMPYLKSFSGFLDNKTFYTLLNNNINMIKIANNTLDTYICCTQLPDTRGEGLSPVYFDIKNHPYTKEELISIAMASSAIYPFFDKVEIEGSCYIDGGFTDNTPILPLYHIGYRKFIVVYLSNKNNNAAQTYASKFPDAQFIDIRPDPKLHTGKETTLNFSRDFITMLMADGYVQTMKAAQQIASF